MKTLRSLCLCALAMILTVGVVSAQDINVSGTVTDKTFGEPVIGAAVMIVGTDAGTITDIDGKFQITAPTGSKLQFSSVGMKTVVYDAAPQMDIILEDDVNFLEEVVVTGYMAEKKADLTGSVSVVKMKDVADVPTGNVMQALQGRVAGMNVTTDGTPVHRKLSSIRIFIDNSSIEVFGNNGEVCLTSLVFPSSTFSELIVNKH